MGGTFRLWAVVFVVAVVAILGRPPEVAADCNIPTGLFHYDFFDESQYPACFRDVARDRGINAGPDVGNTGHMALNITGVAGAGGATWLTMVDQDPATEVADNVYGSGFLCADVLVEHFDNTKGVGVLTLFNEMPTAERPGERGLALILYDAGNSDRLVLATVEGRATRLGRVTPLATLDLNGLIRPKAWYRVVLFVHLDAPPIRIAGQVFGHQEPDDPNSAVFALAPPLEYTQANLPPGVATLGESGVIGVATLAMANASVTNFANGREECGLGLAP